MNYNLALSLVYGFSVLAAIGAGNVMIPEGPIATTVSWWIFGGGVLAVTITAIVRGVTAKNRAENEEK